MATFDSMKQATDNLLKQLDKFKAYSYRLNKQMFLQYHLKIYPNVPIKTGRTRRFPQVSSKAAFGRNTLTWSPVDPITKVKYLPFIYHKNRTGKPEWDMYTAESMNDSMFKHFTDEVLRFIK